MENTNNYTVSDYQKSDSNAEDLEKMERGGDDEEKKKPYSKNDLLEILPKKIKFYFNITRVLEPKNDIRRKLFERFVVVSIISLAIIFGVNLQYSDGVIKPQFGLQSMSGSLPNVVCIAMLYGLIKYFEDSGQNFYNLWSSMPKAKQQSVDNLAKVLRKLLFYFAGFIVLFTVLFVYNSIQDAAIPNWLILYNAIVTTFFALQIVYGYGNVGAFGICLIVCVSHAANREIMKIRTNVIQKLSNYKEEGEKIILKNFSNDFRLASAKLSKGYKYIGKALMIYLFTLIIAIFFSLVDLIINIVQGQDVNIVNLIFLFGCFLPLQVYAAMLLLSTSIAPSNEYTLFVEELQKPDILYTLSKIYGSEAHGMSYFFTGLEASRKDVVWNCFGMPLTFTVYQKVIGSLVSIIILSMTFALRSSVTL
eukprot:g3619.t1